MTWEAISTITEVLGLVVIVITLIYLAAQVRQGNAIAKLQARQRMIEQQDSELYTQLADPSITFASVKEGSLSPDEQAKLSLFLIAFLRQREWEWFQYKEGIIDENTFQSYLGVLSIHLGTPRARKWWNGIGRQGFNPEFVVQVDQLLSQAELNNYLSEMRTWDDA